MTNFVFEFLRQNNWVSKLVEELIFAIKDVAKMILIVNTSLVTYITSHMVIIYEVCVNLFIELWH